VGVIAYRVTDIVAAGRLLSSGTGIITPDPITITAEATIGEAARVMLENKVSGLPVIDERHQVVGMITESDIFSMVVHGGAE
jgi:CBS domain-containing protein